MLPGTALATDGPIALVAGVVPFALLALSIAVVLGLVLLVLVARARGRSGRESDPSEERRGARERSS